MTSTVSRTALLAMAALLFVGCGDATTSDPSTTLPPGATSAPTTVPATVTTPPATVPASTTVPSPIERVVVATFFSRDGVLAAGSRAVPKNDTVRSAVATVIEGPNTDELSARFDTAIPSGTTLRNVSIEQRKATVDVSAAFTTGGGSLSMRMRVAQIVYTLSRLGVADSVRFMIDGKAVESIGGEGLIVTDVKPSEFDDLLPPVLTEFPTPGATVAPGFAFKGLANVFEGTVNFELLDAGGAVITQGFATGMMGAWGQFQATVSFAPRPAGPLTFVVFTISAADGRRQDEMRIPVRVM
ncbi:MAG TPA: Gmad2 immunoglobulin-like domain-containing protein [Acidimicrobiales bacterium]|nr:Gmad2 immunoglobulin-like domain-containing protein [Acidimicrobiales bacterium]